MTINLFSRSPFSVEYNGISEKLSNKEISIIVIAALVGLPFLLIGALFASAATSYYFRNKKVKELEKENLSATAQKTVDVSKEINKPQHVEYTKGVKRTHDLIPTVKDSIGGGAAGTVFIHGDKAHLVVKKCTISSRVGKTMERAFVLGQPVIAAPEREFAIGSQLNHPHLVKMRDLYLKKYPEGQRVYKLVMDKIEGDMISEYYSKEKELSDELVKKLLLQARDCCLYLFDQKVRWADLNTGNIFVTKEKKDLMLCDYGHWYTEENPLERTLYLMLGSMEIVQRILKGSSLENNNDLVLDIEKTVFSREIFGTNVEFKEIFSHMKMRYEDSQWMQDLNSKIANMDEQALRNFLGQYFEYVLETYCEKRGFLNQIKIIVLQNLAALADSKNKLLHRFHSNRECVENSDSDSDEE